MTISRISFHPISCTKKDEVLFSGYSKIEKEASHLLRLTYLDRHLPRNPAEKSNVIDKIKGIWNRFLQTRYTSVVAGATLDRDLSQFGLNFSELYDSDGETRFPETTALQAFQDLEAVRFTSPLQKSTDGLMGPTFLVRFLSKGVEHAHVIKWTEKLNGEEHVEQAANRLYSAFSSGFSSDGEVCLGFKVPPSTYLDFQNGIHEYPNGYRKHLPKSSSQRLEDLYSGIAKTYDKGLNPEDRQLLITKRLEGENILDFARSGKYNLLTLEQKETLFERLGRLAMTDLMFGNLDRFIGVYSTESGFELDDIVESNLGNAMVVTQGVTDSSVADFSLYAIDNGVHKDLILNLEKRGQYIEFLRGLLFSKTLLQDLSTNIITCIQNGFGQIDNLPGDTSLIRKAVKPFINDLKNPAIGKAALEKGLRDMLGWLQQDLVPAWNNATPLQKHLHTLSPELLASVDERLQLLRT